ncbi:MAG: TonB-dependent receptor [Pyrinomonadaceae bacterium]|nr:TonB-dependent receptor [Pyrinomonadaceae bacterium]
MDAFNLQVVERQPRLLQYVIAVVCCALLTTTLTLAQGTRGNISGTVTDPNGAVVAGAGVRLVNSVTQQDVRTVQTNDEGVFQFLEIEPATYDVIITASGFAEAQLRSARVEPNRSVRLDTALGLSGTTDEVTVTAGQELVDRESPTLGTTVDPRRVIGLPLDGRNILDLALLQPGVTTNAAGTIRANGARGVENNFQLDGSNNNEIAVGGQAGFQPRPDAVQEFRLLTSNYEAEFGRNTGAVINVVTKSGTNGFHGNVRVFYRPTVLSAARYFDQNDPSDTPRAGTRDDFRRRYERKEFGGQIGGPIYLPRFGEGGPAFYSGKNRAFFFADYEGRRQLIGSSNQLSNLPSAEEKQGIFTRRAASSTASPIPLLDPATGAPFPILSGSIAPGQTLRQQIPSSRFSPIGLYYLGFLPTGNANGQSTVAANEIRNFDVFTARVDPLVTDKQNLGFTFNYYDNATLSPFPFSGTTNGANVPGFGSNDLRTTYNVVARHTYTISPTLVNSFLAGYARNDFPSLAPDNQSTPSQIGFTANFVAAPQFAGPPFIFLDDRQLRLGNTFQGPQARVTENFQIQDSVSYAFGNHRFKFGVDGTKYKQNTDFLFINQGIIGYSAFEEANTTGDDLADLLIGNSPGYIQFGSNGERDFRQFGVAGFVQDNWRVSPALTFSLGLRYEYVGPLTDLYNRVGYYRPTAAARGISSQLLASGQLRTPQGVPIIIGAGRRAPLGLLYPGDPDPDLGGTVPDGGVSRDLNNFAPRFGFAYSPQTSDGSMFRTLLGDNATVIRGGFGVFYGSIIGDTALQQLTAPGYQGTNAYFEEVGGLLANPFGPDPYPNFGNPAPTSTTGETELLQPTIENPFLNLTSPNLGVSSNTRRVSGATRLTALNRALDPRIRTPYTYQYNLTLERSFLTNYVASVSYVGNRGRKLYAIEQLNPAYGTSFLAYPDSFSAAERFAPTIGGTNINARRVNTDVAQGIASQVAAGNSWYNSLQANVTRRFADGLLFQVAYTFSKSITDLAGLDTNRGTLDIVDRSFGRGLSPDDVPHRLVGSFIYELPFGNKSSGFTKTLLGGFSLRGIYTLESGRPFTVNNVTNTTGTGGGVTSFADIGTAFTYLDPRENRERAFNADAFRDATLTCGNLAVCARRGTSGPGQFRAKNGINNFNVSLVKMLQFTESTNLELRFEAFNAFNHTQFGPNDESTTSGGTVPTGLNLNLNSIVRNPDGTIDPNRSAFGKFTSARESRVIQLGARFSF